MGNAGGSSGSPPGRASPLAKGGELAHPLQRLEQRVVLELRSHGRDELLVVRAFLVLHLRWSDDERIAIRHPLLVALQEVVREEAHGCRPSAGNRPNLRAALSQNGYGDDCHHVTALVDEWSPEELDNSEPLESSC